MHKLLRQAVLINAIILFFYFFSSNATVLAKKPSGSLGLDFNVPREERHSTEADLVEEKYLEIMEEISISPKALQIVEQIKAQVEDVRSIRLEFVVSQVKGTRTERVCGTLMASLDHKLARVEFVAPDALRGYIMVVDQEKLETKTFRPVLNQITVQALEDVSKEAFSALSVADITSYFDFTQYVVEVLETENEDGVENYLLQVEGWKDQDSVQVAVNSRTWIPAEISLFEEDIFLGKLQFSDVVINEEVTADKLKSLPEVKEISM